MGQGNKNYKRTWTKPKDKKQTKLEKEINKLKKPGKTYTPAQLLALKRKAQGKTISQVKSENQAAMRKRAAAKNATFKASQKLKIKNNNNKEKKKKKENNEVYIPKLSFIK